jgi:prepilin-type N-terminal cleavage/methylation domain-containing protein
MKKALTLIEVMLVISIISLVTISSLTGFQVSSSRLKFQNQTQSIQSTITTHRAQAFNNKEDNIQYNIQITPNQITNSILNTSTQDQTTKNFEIPSTEVTLNTFNAKSTTSTWQTITNPNIQITINSSTRECQIQNTTTNENYLILHIPITKPNQTTPSKHLYIQRENCLVETLNTQIQN